MTSEKQFWQQITDLHKGLTWGEQKRLFTTREYEEIYDKLHRLYGDRSVSSFVQLCAMMQNGEVRTVVKGLLDLRQHDWQIDRILQAEKSQATQARRSRLEMRGDYLSAAMFPTKSYVMDPMQSYNLQRLEFLRKHRECLSAEHKQVIGHKLRFA